MQRLPILALIAAPFLVATFAAAGPAPADDVRREGEGEYRAKVDALELHPLPEAALSALGSWTNGQAPAGDALATGPALYVTWACWYKTSFGGLDIAEKLHQRFAADGLLVVGVHHPKGYDSAAAILTDRGVTFPVAMDAGAFREALHSDTPGGPDFYIVDRAGNLRFADVSTSDVEDAVALVMAETAEQAALVPQQRREAVEQAARDAAATRDSNGLKPGELLSVPFDLPPAAEYAAADWPAHNRGNLNAADYQGKALPKPLGSETYLSGEPDAKGRLVIIDFWATWCPPCRKAMPLLDEIHKQHQQDLVVIGISNEAKAKVETFLERNPHGYTQAVDPKNTIAGPMQVRAIPHAVIISTDGVVRWQGNPLQPDFEDVVTKCLEQDPGIKARRAAEEAHLKAEST